MMEIRKVEKVELSKSNSVSIDNRELKQHQHSEFDNILMKSCAALRHRREKGENLMKKT